MNNIEQAGGKKGSSGSSISRGIAVGGLTVCALGASLLLASCSGTSGAPSIMGAANEVVAGVTDTSHQSEKQVFTTVIDEAGAEQPGVVYVEPIGTKKLDKVGLKALVDASGIPYEKIIAGNNKGSGTLERGYVYLTSAARYDDILSLVALSNDGFSLSAMGMDEYNAYVADKDGNANIYYSEEIIRP